MAKQKIQSKGRSQARTKIVSGGTTVSGPTKPKRRKG